MSPKAKTTRPVLLVYDVGNTNVVVGLFRGKDLVGHWRVSSARDRTGDELRLFTRNFLDEAEADPSQIDGVAAASVVPSLNRPLESAVASLIGKPARFLNAQTAGIRLDVEEPEKVGADRIANAIAGFRLYGGPLLVVDFGTAINFDLVSGDGAFLGGAIAPEMGLAAGALFDRAAQLAAVDLEVPDSVVGKTTAANVQAGVVLGFFDLVAGLIARFKREYSRDLKVIATGGKGELFAQHVPAIEGYAPFLTLEGLRLAWESWEKRQPIL